MMKRSRKVEENHGTYRKPPVEHLVLEDVGEGGGVLAVLGKFCIEVLLTKLDRSWRVFTH